MQIKHLFLASVALLPIQTIGLDIGFMTVKISQVFFLSYLSITVWRYRFRPLKSQKLVLYLLALTFIGLLVSAIFSNHPERSAILASAFLLCTLFYLAATVYLSSERESTEDLKKTLYITSTLYSIYGILQLALFFSGATANVNFEAWDLVPRVPYFSAENVHAAFLLLVLPLIYDQLINSKNNTKNWLTLAFLINCAGMAATGSRGAMLALLLILTIQTLIGIVSHRINIKLITLTAVAAIALITTLWDILFIRFEGIFSGDDGTTNVRISHFKDMFRFFEASPIVGVGLGGSHALGFQDIHNVLLQVLFEGGVIAATPFTLALLIPTIRTTIKTNKITAFSLTFAAILMQAMFEPSLYFYHLYLALALTTSQSLMKYKIQIKANAQ